MKTDHDHLEQDLVLQAIRLFHDKRNPPPPFAAERIDWSRLLKIASENQVLPNIYQWQKEIEQIPVEVKTLAKRLYLENAINNITKNQKLADFIGLLSGQGIDCLVFKGPVMAVLAFHDPSMREFSDLDILVKREDFPRTYHLLARAGYSPEFQFDDHQLKWMMRSETEFTFRKEKTIFEVHWEAAELGLGFPLRSKDLWENTQEIDLTDCRVRTFSMDNTILFACLHGAKHQWRVLKWITDLAYLCQSLPNTNWSALLTRARQIGMHRLVCLGMQLAQGIGGAVLTPQDLALIQKDKRASRLASEIIRLFQVGRPNAQGLGTSWFYIQCRERLRDRLYYIFDQIVIPKRADWQAIVLPGFLFPVYYLIRPARLFLKFGWAAISSLILNSKKG